MKIRAKIILSIIPLIVLPPLLVTLVSFLWTRQIATHTRHFNDSSQKITVSITHAMENIGLIFNKRVRKDYDFIADNTTGTLKLINTFVERELHQLAVSSVVESYMTVSGSGRDFIAPSVYKVLHDAALRSGFLSISILDKNGSPLLLYPVNVTVPALDLPENPPRGWRVYHKTDLDPPKSLVLMAPLCYDGLQVNYIKGKLAGWIVIDLPFSNFIDQLEGVRGTETLYLLLKDSQENILYQPEAIDSIDDLRQTMVINRTVIPNTMEVEFRIPWKEIEETTENTTELMKSLESEAEYARNISSQVDKFAMRAIIPFSFTLLLVVLVAVFMSGQLARSFTEPITKLSNAAAELAAGDLSVNPRLNGNDEVAELSFSLDRMRLALRDHINNLDRLVAAKTNDLNVKTKALAVSERETRELITRMNDAFAFLEVSPDSSPRIIFSNPAYNQLAADNAQPSRPVPFLSEGQYDRCINVAYTGVADRFDVQTDDDRFYSFNIYSPSPTRLAVVISNLTQKHQAEMESRRLEEAMRHTQKLESLGVLAGGIAHDFNNLLMAIMGNADLALLDAPPGSPIQENLTEIQKSSLRAAGLCKQMLAYSGQGQFLIENCELSDLINGMTQLIAVTMPQNVEVQYDFDPNLPLIEADPAQIRQVILNVVTNAAEAISGENGQITIRTQTEMLPEISVTENPTGMALPAGDYVVLQVQDNGHGMSEETLSHIFDPFFTTKMTGRGLGMPSVMGIVRSHKGLIRVASKENEGTMVSIFFPVSRAAAPQKNHDAAVLIAESEADIASVLERMLQKTGAKTKVLLSGQAAYDEYTAHPEKYSHLLITHQLTLNNNVTLVRAILSFDPKAKIIVSSARSPEETSSMFKDLSVLGYIQKPFQLAEVREMCEKYDIGVKHA